jgi:hypothetical protein
MFKNLDSIHYVEHAAVQDDMSHISAYATRKVTHRKALMSTSLCFPLSNISLSRRTARLHRRENLLQQASQYPVRSLCRATPIRLCLFCQSVRACGFVSRLNMG